MPPESRDRLLSRTSNDPKDNAYILRHVKTLLEMAGKRYGTIDALVEKLSCCSDTGEFTLQHYIRVELSQGALVRGDGSGSSNGF